MFNVLLKFICENDRPHRFPELVRSVILRTPNKTTFAAIREGGFYREPAATRRVHKMLREAAHGRRREQDFVW